MKSFSNTTLRLASLFTLLLLGTATTAMAQKIDTSRLDALAAKASESIDVNIDESLIQLAARALSSKEPDEKKVKDIVNGLKGIYVRSFEFELEGQYSEADLESIRVQLPNWDRIVNIRSKKSGSMEVYLMHSAGQITGLAVLASEPKEITIVNIVGPVDLEKLSELEGQFGVPVLGLEQTLPTPKRKN
ncbi:MAG TPA: DUF4252 domain-containing protein [Pyrinomonadaceae bacterium]|nr:DUF4252 domain-containing protein [Pyrinomonadaceae bacterium]